MPWPEGMNVSRTDLRVAVVNPVDEVEAVATERPAGETPRHFFHVGLGVVADAERKELHELARVVLVRRFLDRHDVIEPEEHRRIGRDFDERLLEVADRPSPEELVLREHETRVVDLGVRRREVSVPEEGELLLERPRGVQHPVEPPVVDLDDLAEIERELREPGLERAVVDRLVIDEPRDGLFVPQCGERLDLGRGWPESGASQQVRGGVSVPGDGHGSFSSARQLRTHHPCGVVIR